MTRLAALVPMRHDSERVPGKNYRQLGDRPLFMHIVDTLRACPDVEVVVIDTDSPDIRRLARERYGDDVVLLERPEHLRDGHTPMNDVLLHDIEQVPAELYLQTHSTNPLLRASTVTEAIRAYREPGDHDSLFGVTRLQTRLWDAEGRPVNHDPSVLQRTQDLPPVYEENSNLYLFTGDVLRERGNRIGRNPRMFEVPAQEAWDIDEELDFIMAEHLWRVREGRP